MRSAVFAVVALAGVACGQDLVTNGSFEDAQQSGPTRVGIGNLTDWNASGGFMLLEQGFNNISFTEAHTGTQFVSMGHNGVTGDTLSQTLITVPGDAYTVSFWAKSIQGVASQEVTATAQNASDSALLGSLVAVVNQGEWMEYSFNFTASSASTDLILVHTRGSSGANVALDTVSVVPAPSAAALCGVAGLMAGRRRR